jgi:PTS system nitrogen regulatory IIA component
MNHIAPLLDPQSILLDMAFPNREKLFAHAGGLFATRFGLKAQDVVASLAERERLGSTALGHGVAIPHGRIKGLAQAAGAFYRMATPLEFAAPDHQPVTLCFILVVPKNANDLHLQILGELAQLFGDPAMRERLRAEPTPAGIHTLFNTWTT